MRSYSNAVYKKLLLILIIFFSALSGFALDLDMSVDDEIRRNYNPSKLENDTLPPLPKTEPTKAPTKLYAETSGAKTSDTPTKADVVDPSIAIKINKGTKIRVKLNTNISDNSAKNSIVSFTTLKPVNVRYMTIPAGTFMRGKIISSHTPQPLGNGGLIRVKITSMQFQGGVITTNAKVTKAKNKKIYLNNIKGQRGYIKGVVRSTTPGWSFYKTMSRVTSNFATNSVTMILTPFTSLAGILFYGANIICSPVLGAFAKGKGIALNEGTEMEIKMTEDVYLY